MISSRNIFLCTTEYHLLLSLHIICSFYGSKEFENLIVMTTGIRINVCTYDSSVLSNVRMVYIDWYELRSYPIITDFLEIQCNNFFYYLSNFPVHRYIVRCLSKKGTKIILVQDGLKPYVEIQNDKLRIILSNIYLNFRECLKLHYFSGIFRPYNNSRYVNDKHINEVWLTHPNSFFHKIDANQSITTIPEFSAKSIQICSSYFKYNLQIHFQPNSILYITQPLFNTEHKLAEIHFLKNFLSKYKNRDLYIKFHPSRDMDKNLLYKELSQAKFLENVYFPAELIIQNMNNAIIMSLYSTALLFNNPKCRFYFTYPILNNNLRQKIPVPNPIDHIKVISNVNEIQFYAEE